MRSTITISVGALLLMVIAIYNGYPILYSDSASYINSGFSLETPIDRPITYGLFIRIFSIYGLTLWTVIFAQCLLLSYVLFKTVCDFISKQHSTIIFGGIIIFLTIFTGVSFISGQLITDIFPSISVLCLTHLLFNSELKRRERLFFYIVFFWANAFHMSHIIINSISILSLFILIKFFPNSILRNSYKTLTIVLILTLGGILTMGASISKSKHVFFLGRMAENGILQDYLNENCENKNYKLCKKLQAIPASTTEFLWNPESPLYSEFESWKESKDEFEDIILSTLLNPKYLFRHIKEAIKNTGNQLITFDVGDGNGSFFGNTEVQKSINKYFPNDINQFKSSFQSKSKLTTDSLSVLNWIYRVVLSVSIILLLYMILFYERDISLMMRSVVLFILYVILINAFVNSSLVMSTDRFGAKLIWMIPFSLILLILDKHFNNTKAV